MEDLRANFLFCPTPIYFSDFGVLSPCFLRILIPSVLLAYLAVAWVVKTFLTGKFTSSAEDSGYVRLEHEEYAGETQHLLSEDVEETLPGRVARKIIGHIPNPKAVLDKSLVDVKVIIHLLIFEIFIVLAAFWFKADEKTPLAHHEYPYYAGLWMLAIVPWLLHAHMLSLASKSGPITDFLQRGGHDSRNIKGFWVLAFALTLIELQHFAVYRKHYMTIGSDSPYAWAALLVASPIIRGFGLLPLVVNVLFLELGAAKPEHNPAFDIESGVPGAAAPVEYEHDVARRQQVLGSRPPATHSPVRGDRAVHVPIDEPSPQRSQNGDSLRSEFETILAAARAARQPAPATENSEPATRTVKPESSSASAKSASATGVVPPAGSTKTAGKGEAVYAKPSAFAANDEVRLDSPKNAPVKPTPASGWSIPQSSVQKDTSKPADTKPSNDKKAKSAEPKPQQIDTPSPVAPKASSADVPAAPFPKAEAQKADLKTAVQDVPAPATSTVAGIVADAPASGGPSTLLRHLSTAQSTESLNSTASTNADEDDDDESPDAKPAGAGDGGAAKKKKKNKKKKKGKK
ncbi:hypothetical protein HDU87_004508 [Geranomyces variabilis]|uniref:Uncharacterized protein n=1 Tax=Geranomyces variabilis TaxID=109894 RepID=A0AAD5XPU1_9FUNG|nr:hypothetical protein HDU87_004508 [Geranomyces variabilis]